MCKHCSFIAQLNLIPDLYFFSANTENSSYISFSTNTEKSSDISTEKNLIHK